MTGGSVIMHPFSTQGASPQTGHVCFGRRFIKKNKIPGIHPVKLSSPFFPLGGDLPGLARWRAAFFL